MLKLTAALMALLLVTAAHAEDCKAIADSAARLACFDKATVDKPVAAPKAAKKKAASAGDPFAVAKSAMQRKLTDPMSAQWVDLYKVATPAGEMVCGMVNSKNRMGGYAGATGFIYIPSISQAILMFNGVADPEPAVVGLRNYCIYCSDDPRSDPKVKPHCVNFPH